MFSVPSMFQTHTSFFIFLCTTPPWALLLPQRGTLFPHIPCHLLPAPGNLFSDTSSGQLPHSPLKWWVPSLLHLPWRVSHIPLIINCCLLLWALSSMRAQSSLSPESGSWGLSTYRSSRSTSQVNKRVDVTLMWLYFLVCNCIFFVYFWVCLCLCTFICVPVLVSISMFLSVFLSVSSCPSECLWTSVCVSASIHGWRVCTCVCHCPCRRLSVYLCAFVCSHSQAAAPFSLLATQLFFD